MYDIALRRLRLLPLTRGAGRTREQALGLLTELAELGYRVTNPEALAVGGVAAERYAEVMQTLSAMRGGDKAWVPLFRGFPERVPEEREYFARRIMGWLGSIFGIFESGERLETGVTVPDWLFDLEQFGADPITQLQTREAFLRGAADQSDRRGDEHTEWIDLEAVAVDDLDDRLTAWLRGALYAKSALKEAVREDLAAALAHLGPGAVDPAKISQKETLAFALRVYWDRGDGASLAALTRSSTDLLRLFALLTDTDVSLATAIRYPKLTRAQRRMVLGALASSASSAEALAEDLDRYRGLWLKIARGLHLGARGARQPAVVAAFALLREDKVRSFASVTEAHLRSGDVPALLAHLRRRPGTFARRLHEVLRRFPGQTGEILVAFDVAADRVPVKTLLVLDAHLQTINHREERAIVNKKGVMKVLPNTTRGGLDAAALAAVRETVESALTRRLAERSSMAEQAVYVDPALAGVTVPLQQRAASDGLITLGRGSRIPLDMDRVLRLFVYWRQAQKRTDLDLSVIQFGESMNYLGHVSYTRLKGAGIVHSGDLQSAPQGAAEFIDITLSDLPEGARYLAPQVYRYCGESFEGLAESFAGWMIRSSVDSDYKSFDPKTVQNGFALTGRAAYAIPLLVDLARREIVLVDLYVKGLRFHNRAEGAKGDVATLVRQIADFTNTRPTMGRLADLHARARGGVRVDDPAAAEVTFGVNEGTWRASDAGQVLSELL